MSAEALYLSAALGADPASVRAGLLALSAPPSPWSQARGDAGNTCSAPVRGPRRGEITARWQAPGHIESAILDEDGSVLVSTGSALSRLDGETLEPRPPRASDPYRGALEPSAHAYPSAPRLALGADGLLVATVGQRLVEIDRDGDAPRAILDLDGGSGSPKLDPSGWLVVRTGDGARARRRSPEADLALPAPPPRPNDDDAWEALVAGNCDAAALPATNGELIALALEAPAIRGRRLYDLGGHRLRVFDVRGRRRFSASVGGFWLAPPVLVADGILALVERGGLWRWPSVRLVAFDFDGRARWAREVFRSDVWESGPDRSKYALAALPDGTAYVATDADVMRVDRDGGARLAPAVRSPGEVRQRSVRGPRRLRLRARARVAHRALSRRRSRLPRAAGARPARHRRARAPARARAGRRGVGRALRAGVKAGGSPVDRGDGSGARAGGAPPLLGRGAPPRPSGLCSHP